MPPDLLPFLGSLMAGLLGALAGLLVAGRRATLERQNQSQLASANYEYSRGLQEHSQFIARKHEVVAELHVRLLDAYSTIMNIAQGRCILPRLDAANLDDVRKLMKDEQVLMGVQGRVEELWDTDRAAASSALLEYLQEWKKEKALRGHVKAQNYLLNHQLYLSAATVKSVQRLLKHLENQLWQFNPPRDLAPSMLPKADRGTIDSLHDQVTKELRQELRAPTDAEMSMVPRRELVPKTDARMIEP
jgi:hypothetical protein